MQELITEEIFKASQYAPVLKGNSIWIKCPYHADGQERTPSCRINLEKGKYPVGFFYCYGCSKHGEWNELAEKLHLAKIDKSEEPLQINQLTKHQIDSLYEENTSINTLNMDLCVSFEKNDKWRGISGGLLNNIGAKLCPDLKFNDTFVFLPCIQLGKEVGNIKAVLKRKPGQLGYINSSGDWAKRGLFPYDYVKSIMPQYNNMVALVEGPRDALNLIQYGFPALAILGSQNWSKYKAELIELLNPNKIVFMFDGDEAGNRAYEKVRESFKFYDDKSLFRFNFDNGKDPADLNEDEVKNLFNYLVR